MHKEPALSCVHPMIYRSSSFAEVLPVTRGNNLVFEMLIVTRIADASSNRAEDETSIQTQGKHLFCPAGYPLQLYSILTPPARETRVTLCCFSAAHDEFEAGNPFIPLPFSSTEPSRTLDLQSQSTFKALGTD